MSKRIDLVGNKYSRLTVIAFAGTDKYGQSLWLCRCECGTWKVVKGTHLKTGNSKSCGCLNRELVAKRGVDSRVSHKTIDGVELKRCRTCESWKPLGEFVKDKRALDGLYSQCKKCLEEYKLQSKYNITTAQRDQMIHEQGNKCKCCGDSFVGVKSAHIHVDHDHTHGHVRGILCAPCNRTLGNLESPKRHLYDKYLLDNFMCKMGDEARRRRDADVGFDPYGSGYRPEWND